MNSDVRPVPARFHSLDVIRGLAALTVVVWHWQHFLLGGVGAEVFRQGDQPFYSQLTLFYHWGWLAVDFFFSLSGFVFFWLYGQSVGEHWVDGVSFSVARFSRLYPLHLATFGAVMAGQALYRAQNGTFFIYSFNDGYHALLNVFMASGWGLEKGPSYNGPIWSVSIEVLLYLMFFLLCRWRSGRPIMLGVLVVSGLCLLHVLPALGRGMVSFFAGGLAYAAYTSLRRTTSTYRWVPCIAVLIWMAVLFDFCTGQLSSGLESVAERFLPRHMLATLDLFEKMKLQGIVIVLFPLTIVSLALVETWRGTLGRRVAFIGHLSYSSYLLHFPLQLAFVLAAGTLGVSRDFFYTRESFLLFVAVLIPLCFASYRWLELPAQRVLRRTLMPARHL